MLIALAQLNQTVGDLEGNAARIVEAVERATDAGARLVVTSELSLLGYPARDLLLDRAMIGRSWQLLEEMARRLSNKAPALVGLAEPNDDPEGRPLFNCAALLQTGAVRARYRKTLLPTYDVFDEDRYFEPARGPQILPFQDASYGVTVCEDLWNDRDFWQRRRYHVDPAAELAAARATALLNLSASPFGVGKQQLRESMLASMAAKHRLPIVYVNQVGGNDDLVFDGRSCAFDATGKLVARAKGFEPDLLLVDFDQQNSIAAEDFTPSAEIWRALVLGTRDYVNKCGFRGVVLGLSGGIDSAVTAVVAAAAVGAENVLGVMMPSPYSSRGSVDDSEALAKNLGIRTLALPIRGPMEAFDQTLVPAFAGRDRDVTEENIQARIRGTLLMAMSNKFGSLLLTTGNKSELAVGYCTLYGDMSGGLAVISDLFKGQVYDLARWINREREIIPTDTITKPPSAELRPGQKDQDSLPPYELLDEILRRHVEEHEPPQSLVASGLDRAAVERVLSLLHKAEFKRRQAAPGLKMTGRAFGTGWRMPVACRHSLALDASYPMLRAG